VKQPSLIFRIHRFVYFLLRGIGRRESEHYLFTLDEPLNDFELYSQLALSGWTPNYLGFVYKGQVYQCRRLVNRGRCQYHVRCYDDGKVTGHYEVAPEWSAGEHLSGAELRTMNDDEARRLKEDIAWLPGLREKYRRPR